MESGTIKYVGYMWVVHWEDVGIMLILSPETSHILSVLPLHNSTEGSVVNENVSILCTRASQHCVRATSFIAKKR